jgi:methylmalonyl-CoA/ethylmalonyl-CoA epimerase
LTGPDADLVQSIDDLIERLDHFSIAVESIEDTSSLVSLMGGEPYDSGLSHGGDFHWAQYVIPGGKLELIAAADTADETHFINVFTATRGEGLHHLTFKVTDINAAAERASELGFSVFGLDDTNDDWKEAFVHPKSAHGVLIQLAEFPDTSV